MKLVSIKIGPHLERGIFLCQILGGPVKTVAMPASGLWFWPPMAPVEAHPHRHSLVN